MAAGKLPLTLPPDFPVFGIPLVGVFVLTMYQSASVMDARKVAGVKYPNLYATAAEADADPKKMKFNCLQRAHANTLESLPQVLSLSGFFAIFYPKVASCALLLWCLGRWSYTRGYATGDPAKRVSTLYRVSYIGLALTLFGSLGVSIQALIASL